jgi:tRNA modification GTPase
VTASTETIAALATPHGEAAIALLRASGPLCPAIAASLAGSAPTPRMATHLDYHGVDGSLIDDVLLTFFQGPHSYTGEDSLEITCHGNPFIVRKLLDDLCARGCRHAEPGEFTKRAFLNERLDLSQAEAVIDLIKARSDRALASAQRQLRGALARRVETLADQLLSAIAGLEAYIDFPEEDLPPEDRQGQRQRIQTVVTEAEVLLATTRYGSLLREGISLLLIGEPNAGKSSLLNCLAGYERALVSPEPGTTRDFLEESLPFGPHRIRVLDTAGLRATAEGLEQRGMDKTMEQLGQADLIALVVDATAPLPSLPPELQARMEAGHGLVALNKLDLARQLGVKLPEVLFSSPVYCLSALSGEGVDRFRAGVARKVEELGGDSAGVTLSSRHAQAVTAAAEALRQSLVLLDAKQPLELVAAELRSALHHLGEIVGRFDNELMLDKLFHEFCIGK